MPESERHGMCTNSAITLERMKLDKRGSGAVLKIVDQPSPTAVVVSICI